MRAIAPFGNLYYLFPVFGWGHAYLILEEFVEGSAAAETQIRAEGLERNVVGRVGEGGDGLVDAV